ncbi:MAG: hypothetical protein H0T89_23470 [Deltaproteobacteria bacterium]|nr:hypothetical protein [Deltaproteobacteria bacterium]MDQ3299202.1 Ig-like domain-containing protein [Myxococcota bacterium]
MQRFLVVSVLGVAVFGCSDDGGNKLAPDTALVETPPALSNAGRVRILFEARGNANTFFCQLDANPPSPCVSPFEADVADGDHTFAVAAALNQNVDETPAMHAWHIDTAVPETTIVSGPPSLDNSLAPELAFTGTDNRDEAVTFECALDGAAFAACTSPHTLTVVDGAHSFLVRAKDAAGNIDPSPADHAWTIDATAPDTAIILGPPAGTTSGPTGELTFSSPDATATFECSLDGAAFTACTSPFAFTLPDGVHTFAVRAKDPLGILDPSPATRTWTVDATPPPVTITTTPNDPSNVTTPMFGFTSTDATATFACQVDGVTTFTACTSPFTSPALTDGSRTFRVRATDPFGNTGAPATFTWLIDTVAPTVTLTAQPLALSNDTTPTVAFTTAGAAVALACAVDAGAFVACTSPFTTTVAEGTHTLTVRATDAAGNSGTATTAMFVVDITPPTVTITGQPLALSNDTTPTVTFTTAGSAVALACAVDAGAFGACTSPFTTTVAEGTHTITVRATDAAGNSGTATTAMFVVDTTPPTVAITGQPPALSNNNDPQVVFTTGGNPTSTQCQVDGGTLVTCSSPHTFTDVADGAHTITVRVTDAVTNTASATTATFTIDTAPPVIAFVEAPPATWPVNYFTMQFTVTSATAISCSTNGGAFVTCASPFALSGLAYGASSFTVRGVDAAGNAAQQTTNWTSARGLVLHYPWEVRKTNNTSALSQRISHSPTGSTGIANVGGWAGAAAGSNVTAHTYADTIRALSSSPDGMYTASFWMRTPDGANAPTIFSTLTTRGGLSVAFTNNLLAVTVREPDGSSFVGTATIALDRWVHVALRTTTNANRVEIWVDGALRNSVNTPTATGFGAGQATDLTVGTWANLDVDDLRFYNQVFTNAEMCTRLARGVLDANGRCVALSPGFEMDFEGSQIKDTGAWNLDHGFPQGATFATNTLGLMMTLGNTFDWGYFAGQGATFNANVNALPGGRSFTLGFVAGGAFGRLIDFTAPCNLSGAPPPCGISLSYADNGTLSIYTASPNVQKTTAVTNGVTPNRFNNVVVTEQRSGTTTVSITVFVNGKSTVIAIGAGDVYQRVSNNVRLNQTPGLSVDEYEFWPADLSASPELLCENGADGTFDIVTGTCSLTAGP